MRLKAFKTAVPYTLPILAGFWFLGLAYEISMLDKFKDMGWKKYYLIFGMCDETFSINYTADIPEDVDKGWFMFFVTLLNQFYWVSAATTGGTVCYMLLIQFVFTIPV